MSELNRRDFLAAATLAACACAFCGLDEAHAGPAIGPVDVGPLTGFSKDGITDKWAATNRFLLIHNDNRLYASSARCTHKNFALAAKGQEIVCSKHGSCFSMYGTVTKGPAKDSLVRFAISVNDKGNVIVDPSTEFREKQWDDPKAFIDLKK